MKAADHIRNFVSENEDKYSIYEGYSGRGMFGRKCLGVIVKEGNSCMEIGRASCRERVSINV